MPSARRVRWAKFRVFCISAVAILILGTLSYLLTGGTLLTPKTRLYLYIPDATGLGPKSPVRVDGIDVGVVDWVKFSGSSDLARTIRVQMTIEKERLPSITADSIAQISNDTLIGDKFVDITTGKAPEHVRAGGEMHFKAQPDLMRSVDMEDIERQLRSVDAMLADIEQGRTPIGQFVIGDQVYASMRRRFTELQSGLSRATAATAQLGSLLYTDALFQKVHAPLARFDQMAAQMEAGQGAMGRFLRDPAQYEELRSTLQDLQKTVSEARSAGFVKSDEAYLGWNKTIADLARQVDQVNVGPMLNSPELYETWNGSMREMQKTLKDFRGNPKKYLRLKVF